jgi:hypothetical protein
MQIREVKFNGLIIAFVLNAIFWLNGCKTAYTYELYKYTATKENLIATFPGESEFQAEHNCKIFSEMHEKEYGIRLMCLKGGSSSGGTPSGGNTGMLMFILVGMAVGMLLVKFYKTMTENIAACIKCRNPLAEIDLRCSKCDEPVMSQRSPNSPTTAERWHKHCDDYEIDHQHREILWQNGRKLDKSTVIGWSVLSILVGVIYYVCLNMDSDQSDYKGRVWLIFILASLVFASLVALNGQIFSWIKEAFGADKERYEQSAILFGFFVWTVWAFSFWSQVST